MSDPEAIREQIARSRRELGEDVDALADKVNPSKMAQRQAGRVKRAVSKLSDRVMGTASDVADSAQGLAGDAGEAMADAPRKVARATGGNPIAAGLIAFGVGWLASSLVPSSQPERRLAEQAKEAAEPLLGEMRDVAMSSAEHLREPAQEAVDAVKERATEAVGTIKEEGQDAAEEVRSEAKHAVDRETGGTGGSTGAG